MSKKMSDNKAILTPNPKQNALIMVVSASSGVGKSNWIRRVADEKFDPSYGFKYPGQRTSKEITISLADNRKFIVNNLIFEIKEETRTYPGSRDLSYGWAAAFVMYDVTNSDSYYEAENCIKNLQKEKKDAPIMLVATKSDLLKEYGAPGLGFESGQDLADRYGIPFFECSSKDNTAKDKHGNKPFISMLEEIDRQILVKTIPPLTEVAQKKEECTIL